MQNILVVNDINLLNSTFFLQARQYQHGGGPKRELKEAEEGKKSFKRSKKETKVGSFWRWEAMRDRTFEEFLKANEEDLRLIYEVIGDPKSMTCEEIEEAVAAFDALQGSAPVEEMLKTKLLRDFRNVLITPLEQIAHQTSGITNDRLNELKKHITSGAHKHRNSEFAELFVVFMRNTHGGLTPEAEDFIRRHARQPFATKLSMTNKMQAKNTFNEKIEECKKHGIIPPALMDMEQELTRKRDKKKFKKSAVKCVDELFPKLEPFFSCLVEKAKKNFDQGKEDPLDSFMNHMLVRASGKNVCLFPMKNVTESI